MFKLLLIYIIFSIQFVVFTNLNAQEKDTKIQNPDSTEKQQNKNSWMHRMYENITKEKYKTDSADDRTCVFDSAQYFKEIRAGDLSNHIGKKVIITGSAVVVKNEYFLVLSDKKLIQVNCNSVNKNLDALKSKDALKSMIEKGENKTVWIYGVALSQHALEGRYLDIDKKIFEMYWNK